MAIAFDAVSTGNNALLTGGTPSNFSITVVTSGAWVYLDLVSDRATTWSSVTCGGTAMTLIATSTMANGASGNGFVARYRLASVSSGAQTLSITSSASIFASVTGISYTGVGSEGTSTTTNGATTALSQTVTITPGLTQWILQSFGGRSTSASGCTLSSLSGGTNRYNNGSSASVLGINDATATTTFTATGGGGGTFAGWAGLATVLVPTAGPGFGATGGWMGAITIPNPFVGPMALRQRKRPPYVPSRNTGLQAPVAFDQRGSGFNGQTSGTTGSWTDNATQGSYVVVALSGFISVTSGGFSGVTYNGTPMTRLCDNYFNSVPANGPLTFYGLANAPGGSNTIQFTTVQSNQYVTANSFSYTGVGGVSPFPWPVFGSSASMSQSITNSVSNSMVFQAFGTNGGGLITALSGGDIRFNGCTLPNVSNVAGLAVQDTSASGALTFSATPGASTAWCGMGIILSPNAWPTFSAAPLNAALTKFAGQQNVTFQIIGDSTGVGFGDGLSLDGWVGRLAIRLGNYYDYNVTHRGYSGSAYGGAVSLRTSARGGAAPTLAIYNGAVSGSTLINLVGYLQSGTQIAVTPDVVFAGSGINEAIASWNNEEFIGLFDVELGFLTNVYCANVPIILGTENPLGNGVGGGTNYATNYPTLKLLESALAQTLVGATGAPLGAALMQGSYNVSILDTQQAFLYQYQTAIMTDGAHPSQFGYQVYADWIASILAPWTVTAIGASCPPVQIANPRVGPMALRKVKRMPYLPLFRAGIFALRDGADWTIGFNRSPDGYRGIHDGANTGVAFTPSISTLRGVRDGANRAIAMTPSSTGSRGIREGANTGISWTATSTARFSRDDAANRSVLAHFSTDGIILRYNVGGTVHTTGTWVTEGDVTASVTFSPPPGGQTITVEIVDDTVDVELPFVNGYYLVAFGPAVLDHQGANIEPFAFWCPPYGEVDLNEVASSGALAILRPW